MSTKEKNLTALLREALREVESVRAVAKATGLRHSSLLRFMHNETSLRLDLADRLAEYFGIESRRINRRRRG
tara:strand:+ start:111 stop:326 length:216 start_codon:yes stop_codon:yes gene_type:complete